MAPTTQSTLDKHGMTAKTTPAKRQNNPKNKSTANAPQVTPAKPPINEDTMEEDKEEASPSNEHGATPSAESNEDSNMEEASNADATAATEDETEEEKTTKAATAKQKTGDRMAELFNQQGRRTASEQGATTTSPTGDDEEEGSEDEEIDDLENNVWTERLRAKNTGQRTKKQATIPLPKPIVTTVLYIEAKGTQGNTPLEVIRNTIAKVMKELSERGKLKGIQLLPNNTNSSSNKPISSASAVPLRWISA